MAEFQYEAINAAGQVVKDRLEAQSPADAAARIKRQGCYPTKLKEARRRDTRGKDSPGTTLPRRARLRAISFGRVSTRAVTEFTQQLSVLQDAGLPIVRSLEILWQQERRGLLKTALARIVQSVQEGNTLSEAMARHPRVFDRLYVNMVAAGETGGVMDVILRRVAEFMEKAQQLRRRVKAAMIYPAVVMSFSIIIVTAIMIFVVPKFQSIFKDFKTTLPSLTIGLMNVANWMAHDFGWTVVLGMPVAAWMAWRMLRKSAAGRRLLDNLTLRLPVIGRIARKAAVARFTRTLGTLLAAGVPFLDALVITRDTVGNSVFAAALKKVHDSIREGTSFAGPLRAAHVCDVIVTNMIDVGEETGDLDKMLLKIADTYDEHVQILVSSLVSLLEPVMVMLLGGMVGTIVLALFLPLAQLLDKMSNGSGAT